jgi:hypothetical protein
MSIFVRKDAAPDTGFQLGLLMGTKEQSGEVGLEVEVEGNKFPKGVRVNEANGTIIPKEWCYHNDGSLRGADNAEYVLKAPLKFEDIPKTVAELWDMFAKYGSKLDVSNRTSVHVHLNVQGFHMNRLTSLMAMWYTFEEVLTAWCGEHRVGNLFCLRAKDAPAIITQVRAFIKSDGKSRMHDGHHYAGLNAQAVKKQGSLEFRTLQGVVEPGPILDWVSILERLYRLSEDFSDPRRVCELFSLEGPMGFFHEILGDRAMLVRAGLNMSEDDIRDSMYEGIRMAQDLCYCRDWTMFKPMSIKSDPFGRKADTVIRRMGGAPNPNTGTGLLNSPISTAPVQAQWQTYTAAAVEMLDDIESDFDPEF